MPDRKSKKIAAGAPLPQGIGLLFDMLSVFLLTLGVTLAMRQLFRFVQPFSSLLFRCGIVTSILFGLAWIQLKMHKKWVLPAAFAGLAALVVLYMRFIGALEYFLSYAWGVAQWWANLFPPTSSYETPQTILLVEWLIVIGVGILMMLMVRRIRSVVVLSILLVALFAAIVLNEFRNNLDALCLIGAGLFPLLARAHYTKLGHRLREVRIPYRRVMACALAVTAAFALLTNWIVPADTYSWKNADLFEKLSEIKIFNRSFQSELMTLKSSGLQPNAGRLGGDITLGDAPVLDVVTDTPTLLKGKVYTDYNGKGWTADSSQAYSLTYDNADQLQEVFCTKLPLTSDRSQPLDGVLISAKHKVTLLQGGYSVYTPGRVISVAPQQGSNMFSFNTRSEVYSNKLLPKRYQYTAKFDLPDRSNAKFAEILEMVQSKTLNGESPFLPDPYYDELYAQYTQLPNKLPQSVVDKAAQIVEGIHSPYQQMQALETYLKTHYQYTLTPGDVPRGEDFVEYFLKSGKGYCVYFASAMAVMARSLGVPSRFVIGYGLKSAGSGWRAYENTAHAWVECYFLGAGWVTFDPTAGSTYMFGPSALQVSPNASQANPVTTTTTTSPTTTQPTTMESGATSSKVTGTTAPDDGSHSAGLLWLWILLGAAAVLLLASLALSIQRHGDDYSLARVKAACPDNAACADQYYTDILRQLSLLKLPPGRAETMAQHGQRAGSALDNDSDEQAIEQAFNTVMDWRYGTIAPSDDEIEQLSALHQALEQEVKSALSPLRYFFERRVKPVFRIHRHGRT